MSYYFTSDLHFGNDVYMRRENRPFSNNRQFEEIFVKNVNDATNADDTLFVIGNWIDCSDSPLTKDEMTKRFSIVQRLHPHVCLILGKEEAVAINSDIWNGDKIAFIEYLTGLGFTSVSGTRELMFGGDLIYLTSHPSKHIDGKINLFGSTGRATGLWKPFGLNMSIDLNYYRPFSDNEIRRLLTLKNDIWDKDADCNS